MDRDEQRSTLAACDFYPVAQRYEGIVVTCHHDAKLALLLDALAQCFGKIKHQILLVLTAFGNRTVVDASVAGVDHHHRSPIVDFWRSCGRRRWNRSSPGVGDNLCLKLWF